MRGGLNALPLFIKGESLAISSVSFMAHISQMHVRAVALEEKDAFLLQVIETKGLLRWKLQAVSLISFPGCVCCSENLWIDIP